MSKLNEDIVKGRFRPRHRTQASKQEADMVFDRMWQETKINKERKRAFAEEKRRRDNAIPDAIREIQRQQAEILGGGKTAQACSSRLYEDARDKRRRMRDLVESEQSRYRSSSSVSSCLLACHGYCSLRILLYERSMVYLENASEMVESISSARRTTRYACRRRWSTTSVFSCVCCRCVIRLCQVRAFYHLVPIDL